MSTELCWMKMILHGGYHKPLSSRTGKKYIDDAEHNSQPRRHVEAT